MPRYSHLALAAAAITAVGLAAGAATLSRPVSSPAPSDQAPVAAGMVVAVDPETGELGMPAPGRLARELSIEDAQAYARQIARELVTEHRPDGSSSLKHDERLADYTVIQMGPDGKPVFQCVHGAQAMECALRTDKPAPPAQEEE
jgi:hypothetical protein